MDGTRLKKFKNSLDSDEEDDEEESKKYNVLNPEDLEGEEEATIDRDGEIQITPFNMKEELEEGHFDKEGTYIFHREENLINDQWLDNIDWVKVKTVGSSKRKRKDSTDSDDEKEELNVIEHYKQMLEIMQPNETVQKAIRRLGGGKSSRTASGRWKKNGQERSKEENATAEDEDYEKLQKLTGLASDILQTGDMDIYEQSFERLKFRVEKAGGTAIQQGSKYSLSTDVDEALDMFGDNFDETASGSSTAAKRSETGNGSAVAGDDGGSSSEVMWDFKWKLGDDSPVYGPNLTSDMIRWVQEGYFADGVWVRQVGKPDSNFYSSKRIDFELYL